MIEVEVKVLMEDVIAGGGCAIGARRWMRQHGLNMADLLGDGVAISTARATGCALAEQVCQAAERRVAKESEGGGE